MTPDVTFGGLATTEERSETGAVFATPRLTSQSLNRSHLSVDKAAHLAWCAICQQVMTCWVFTVRRQGVITMRWRECPDCQPEGHKALVAATI